MKHLQFCDYHTRVEYGISAFWNWYFQVREYTKCLDAVCEQECEYGTFEMPYWGKNIYSCHFVDGECMVYIHEFKFNMRNFRVWLKHQELKEQRISQIVNEVINKIKRLV